MADHRKLFRPRRPTSDGRLLPRSRCFGAALALLGALMVVPDGAVSQEIGLKRGEASLGVGQYEDAVRQLSATVNDSKSTPEQAAKALYLRGIAYRKLGFPGQAISDIGAAVWLGLSGSDKTRALVNKGLAYRAAGLSSQAEDALAQARRSSGAGEVDRLVSQDGGAQPIGSGSSDIVASGSPGGSIWNSIVPSFGSSSSSSASSSSSPGSTAEPAQAEQPQETQTAAAAPSTGWNAEVSDASSEPSGNAVSRWFGSLTGDSAPAPTAPIAPSAANPIPPPAASTATRTTTAARTTTPSAPPAAPPSAASWAANTQTEQVSDESGTALGRWISRQTDSAPAAPAATSQAAASGYTVQLANSQSKSEAEALQKKARITSAQVASAGSRIEKVDIGSFGTFYSVKIGPFASESEGSKVCNALKRGGTDCSVVAPGGP